MKTLIVYTFDARTLPVMRQDPWPIASKLFANLNRELQEYFDEVYPEDSIKVRALVSESDQDLTVEVSPKDSYPMRKTQGRWSPRGLGRSNSQGISPEPKIAVALSANPWPKLLERSHSQNPRATILGATANSSSPLAKLLDGLGVNEFVGVANALYNKCDPTDLEATAPRDLLGQASLAWAYLESAKNRPSLGGKWSKCAIVLQPGSLDGQMKLKALGLDDFVSTALKVVSQVYREV